MVRGEGLQLNQKVARRTRERAFGVKSVLVGKRRWHPGHEFNRGCSRLALGAATREFVAACLCSSLWLAI